MLLLVASSVHASASMSKSNPAALSGVLQNEEQVESILETFPLPENVEEPAVDSYTLQHSENTQRYFKSMEKGSGNTTPRQVSESLSTSHQWSDCTLTRSFSGRYSTCSWGAESADEAEFDRVATEQVMRKFDKINRALYEGKTVGSEQVDRECKEWSSTFPHLMVQGIHLLDTWDDGTEMVEPNIFSIMTPFDDLTRPPESQEIALVGRKVEPIVLQDTPEHERLKEEVIAADGIIEEYFAFDNRDNDSHENSRRSRLKRYRGYRGLPPLTPNACVKDTVRSLVFDHIWSEIISVLQPLCAAIREKASQGRTSCYSLGNDQLTPTHSPLGIGPLQHEPYYFRGLRDQPTLTKAPGQSGSQFLRFKYSTPNLTSTLPQLNNLSDVMQIKPVSLQQRTSMMIPINDTSREGTPTLYARPESSAVVSRLVKNTTPLPPKFSDTQLPITPAHNRLISSRLTNRRNVMTLKPLERSKTPALVPIDNGIRGYKLNTNLSHGSPPTTPFVRNNQLPPLELPGGGGVPATGSSVAVDRSPPMQLKTSAQSRNRVTFNSRVVSAADGQDSWRTFKPPGTDLRPNTTTNSYRQQHSTTVTQEGSSRGSMRKISDHSLSFGRMKVVGIGTGHHSFASSSGSSSTGSNVGLSGFGSEYSRTNGSIAEDEEMVGEGEESSFTITGTSRFLQSKPRSISGRSKIRGHIR